MATQSSIKGVIKVQGVPDSACFVNFTELLRSLGTYLIVEIPNQTFSNIVISVAQPGQADRDKIWWRLANNGTFVGIFFYSNGVWSQVFPAPNGIFWLYGDSSAPPVGYSFDLVSTVFSAPDYATLMAQAIPPGITGTHKYFPTIFVGF